MVLLHHTLSVGYMYRFYSDPRLVANGFHLHQRIGSVYNNRHFIMCLQFVPVVHGQEEIELVSLHKSLRLTDLQETLS